jgi:MazG family protein
LRPVSYNALPRVLRVLGEIGLLQSAREPFAVSDIQRLLDIMSALRDPEQGCPWDLQQDFDSIAPYTIEEAYEVADAIARDHMPGLVDELGDLLFQVAFYAQLGHERGAFTFSDVGTAICDKMVRRHPHVFGNEQVASAADQSRAWRAHKAAERTARGEQTTSVLDGVPSGRPALEQARELQRVASEHGFDWDGAARVLPKLREELSELEASLGDDSGPAKAREELGDLLFTCVNLARHLDLDPEHALRHSNVKFERRFRYLEERLRERDKSLEESDLEEMNALWEEAKKVIGDS